MEHMVESILFIPSGVPSLVISFGVLLREISFWTHLDEIPDGSMAVNLLSNFTTCNLSHNMKVLYTK